MTYQQSHISWSCCQQSKVCIESNRANGSMETDHRQARERLCHWIEARLRTI
jgi:hypothetical protein